MRYSCVYIGAFYGHYNRMPILGEKKWYQEAGIKKPLLQIKNLRHIGLEGQLSKKMAEDMTKSDYSDVSNAIDSLRKKKRIYTHIVLINVWNKGQAILCSNKKRINAFISESYSSTSKSHSSEKFWKAIIWYCILNPKQINIKDLEDHFSYFESTYLGHPAINSYLFQSHFFDKLVNNWVVENNDGAADNTISISQKILESISLTRNITLLQLCQTIGESEGKVRKALDKITVNVDSYICKGQQQDVSIYAHSESKHSDLGHMLIKTKKETDSHDSTYEL